MNEEIRAQIKEVKKILNRFHQKKTDKEIFYDLCFCLCAPQTTFKNNMKVIEDLKSIDLYDLTNSFFGVNKADELQLKRILKPVRFYNNKARYIIYAIKNFSWIQYIVKLPLDDTDKRERLEKNIYGMGLKVASHFLRNQGATDLAIIDTHIINFLRGIYGLSFIDNKNYLEKEELFRRIAKKYNMSVAELDVWIWKVYSETDWKDFNNRFISWRNI
jgi:N-glycosylase/DNA lyase